MTDFTQGHQGREHSSHRYADISLDSLPNQSKGDIETLFLKVAQKIVLLLCDLEKATVLYFVSNNCMLLSFEEIKAAASSSGTVVQLRYPIIVFECIHSWSGDGVTYIDLDEYT